MIHAELIDRSGIAPDHMKEEFFRALGRFSDRRRILLLPPDITRMHGLAGLLTCWAVEFFGPAVTAIMPALGTHAPMTDREINLMFPGIDHRLFLVHDWRHDVVSLGTVPAEVIEVLSEGRLSWSWEAEVNRRIAFGEHDLILSLGQVVPHEVIGMANYNKNIFIGTGGSDGINKSHYLGAVYGMERIMGRIDSPVRSLLDYAQEHFAGDIPLEYALTVIARTGEGNKPVGVFLGDDRRCFEAAGRLSAELNICRLEHAPERVVVYLDPAEYRSTWLGNKSIYRSRMAIADGGELIVLAPGVERFGEDEEIDRLIRRYGYAGTDRILEAVGQGGGLSSNLAAAAHLIHGSSEGRFSIRYCPGALSREEVEKVGYRYDDFDMMMKRYRPDTLRDGWNEGGDGDPFFFISNPASGLWICDKIMQKGA
ncbi:lactate racemase domain-containing protein [Sediminispirochaeta bajacaliforniensis]|uniref:lactate racemase domain-containing protein n=1 Tax=Sediminispirochaeta bajacaliforniensis TaxID=148 RepID=UPI000366576D|nr:lactate racemase domain-containing protein [Sediminispirochaeta bajacaliforniensis]